ncbi:MAG: hypothetical protein ACHQD9_06800 [Chitinophagales bacterium]
MEIHHQHHHDHPQHKEKLWKHYAIEFFMLFLAVSAGFFVENLRENLSENRKLHGYMEEMVENLKADTMRFHHALNYNAHASSYLDSFRYEIDSAVSGQIHSNRLYFLYISTQDFSEILFKEAAISELKNSGSLPLIRDRELADRILEYYDRWVKAAYIESDEFDKYADKLRDYEKSFFNSEYFETLTKHETTFSYAPDTSIVNYINRIKQRNPPLDLLNTNPEDLRRLNNEVISVETKLHYYESFIRLDLNEADALISQIQKEYNLEK